MPQPRRKSRLALALTTLTASPPAAARTIGYPTFCGPAVPAPPVAMTTGTIMRAAGRLEIQAYG